MQSSGGGWMPSAGKRARLRVIYLAYCSTTGLDTIDYRLTDAFLDPPDLGDPWYSEKSVRLPVCYWCYPPPAEAPDIGPVPMSANGHVTFGCLNEFSKVTPAVLSTWFEILNRVPRSKLLLHA